MSSSQQNDSILLTFKAISNFTTELAQMFSSKQRSLKLYCRLINKTTLAHNEPIIKHIDAFRIFCTSNREAIKLQNVSKLVENKISYSNRVFIDMKQIFLFSEKEDVSVIWKHLLYISALVDPAGKAKEILKENMENGHSGTNETKFLTDIIDKVEQHVNPDSNPMDAVSSIMKSGIFTDLIGGMNSGLSDGNLDISKLMGAVQSMIGTLGGESNSDSQSNDAMSMISGLMGNMGGQGNNNQQSNDAMSMISGLMGNLGTESSTKPTIDKNDKINDTSNIFLNDSVNTESVQDLVTTDLVTIDSVKTESVND
jgi:hypothetical protein